MIQSSIIDPFIWILKKQPIFSLILLLSDWLRFPVLFLFFLGLALFIALFTYSPEDPNFIFPDDKEINNFLVLREVLFLTYFFNQLD